MIIWSIFRKFINNLVLAQDERNLVLRVGVGICYCSFTTHYEINDSTIPSLYMENRSKYMDLARSTDPMNSIPIKLASDLGGHK